MVLTTFTNGTQADANEVNANFSYVQGYLGEVRMFALSMTGAETKANLQAKGWAICDGTTPASQGISSATITTTPNLEDKFIRMSDDETSGTTGGSATSTASLTSYVGSGVETFNNTSTGKLSSTDAFSVLPPFYELAFFIKVKLV